MTFIQQKQKEARDKFIEKYCVNRGLRIRWIRAIFIDGEDQIEKILGEMNDAVATTIQDTLKKAIEEVVEKCMYARANHQHHYTEIIQTLTRLSEDV